MCFIMLYIMLLVVNSQTCLNKKATYIYELILSITPPLEAATVLQVRILASVDLILIPASLHLPANYPSAR